MRRRGFFSKGFFIVILLILIGGGVYYILNSKEFERNPPIIEAPRSIISNMKKPLQVKIKDDSGIKKIRILITDGRRILVKDKRDFNGKKDIDLVIDYPVLKIVQNKKKLILAIEAQDISLWNYFKGNKRFSKTYIVVDKKKPELYPIVNSYKIVRGGSAVVVFRAFDENLKDVYIQTNFNKKFIPTPFYKDGYYISLLAWPIDKKNFKAKLVAIDKAGNKNRYVVDLFRKNKRYRVSKIKLKESFLKGKITDLAEDISDKVASLPLDKRFKYINETLRKENETKISNVTQSTTKSKIDDIKINRFYPLKNAAAVASFGDHRFYFYNDKEISSSYHLGLDLASTAAADIISSNDGEVVFAEYNGIYGNNLIIKHILGLYSLYGHCSTIFVQKGDRVKTGEVVAKSGKTGLALGDHLHFGIIVQGIEVRPDEWIDKDWIRKNIIDVVNRAKDIINKRVR